MPNENDSNNPPSNPEGEFSPKSPIKPISSHQDGIGKNPESCAEDKQTDTVESLEQDIKAGEWWLIRISAAGVILNVVIALIYYGQLKEMRKATQAATSAAETADKTLKEIRAGGTDTHELAVQAKNQADRTKDIADRTLTQATATNELARQAKRSADIANEAERPYIGLNVIDIARGYAGKTTQLLTMEISAEIKNFGPVSGRNFEADWKWILAGQTLPGTAKIATQPSDFFPGHSTYLKGSLGSVDGQAVIDGDKTLIIEITVKYDGPMGHIEQCNKQQYSKEFGHFHDLGPMCGK